MTDFFKTKFTARDVVFVVGIAIAIIGPHVKMEMKVSALEEKFEDRMKQGDAALSLLHSINVTLKEHLGEHRGRER